MLVKKSSNLKNRFCLILVTFFVLIVCLDHFHCWVKNNVVNGFSQQSKLDVICQKQKMVNVEKLSSWIENRKCSTIREFGGKFFSVYLFNNQEISSLGLNEFGVESFSFNDNDVVIDFNISYSLIVTDDFADRNIFYHKDNKYCIENHIKLILKNSGTFLNLNELINCDFDYSNCFVIKQDGFADVHGESSLKWINNEYFSIDNIGFVDFFCVNFLKHFITKNFHFFNGMINLSAK